FARFSSGLGFCALFRPTRRFSFIGLFRLSYLELVLLNPKIRQNLYQYTSSIGPWQERKRRNFAEIPASPRRNAAGTVVFPAGV
uniref:hypothetical protein n=1 Tax=Dysosmobacter welbionis TaxID=2093857 RepID=UPI003FEE12B5